MEGAAESGRSAYREPRQWFYVPAREPPHPHVHSSVYGQRIIWGQYKAFMRLSRDIVTALYQFTSKCGQIRKLLWEYGSSCFLHCSLRSISLATFRQDFFFIFLSEVLWREHIRDKRFMWHSGILKKLDTLLLVGQIQNPPESEQMQVFCLQPEEKEKNPPSPSTVCASFTPFSTQHPSKCVYIRVNQKSIH